MLTFLIDTHTIPNSLLHVNLFAAFDHSLQWNCLVLCANLTPRIPGVKSEIWETTNQCWAWTNSCLVVCSLFLCNCSMVDISSLNLFTSSTHLSQSKPCAQVDEIFFLKLYREVKKNTQISIRGHFRLFVICWSSIVAAWLGVFLQQFLFHWEKNYNITMCAAAHLPKTRKHPMGAQAQVFDLPSVGEHNK